MNIITTLLVVTGVIGLFLGVLCFLGIFDYPDDSTRTIVTYQKQGLITIIVSIVLLILSFIC